MHMPTRYRSKVPSVSDSPANHVKSSGTWNLGLKAVSYAKGGEKENEMNLGDKSTSFGPKPLIKAISCTEK